MKEILNQSWQGKLLLGVIGCLSAIVAAFKLAATNNPLPLPFPGGLWLNAIAIFGLCVAILFLAANILFQLFSKEGNEADTIGPIVVVAIPPMLLGGLLHWTVDRFDFGFALGCAFWGVVFVTGIVVFFFAKGEEQRDTSGPEQEPGKTDCHAGRPGIQDA